ncbi:DUF2442 domain-containing protein [Allochromatium humboldtianum]|uniref:DUF2442 domain-containing protein n=1 Tax=Allochromatium humboldtianum TaxID=504901 RepID=A0A850RHC7_9GAMM|nr:DUF2442 domain-containing protein [Allochromatium humboldtianum]
MRAEPFDGFRLWITFIDGQIYAVDFRPLFEASPGLALVRDPAVFATTTVIEGWTVTWPSPDIQIGPIACGSMKRSVRLRAGRRVPCVPAS